MASDEELLGSLDDEHLYREHGKLVEALLFGTLDEMGRFALNGIRAELDRREAVRCDEHGMSGETPLVLCLIQAGLSLPKQAEAAFYEFERLTAERDSLRSRLQRQLSCWHCQVSLLEEPQHCDACPQECDGCSRCEPRAPNLTRT
jgi:hypothetical protein